MIRGDKPLTLNIRTCRWREALATLNRMRSRGVLPDVYSFNGTISACGRAGKWQQALALLKEMEREGSDVRPDIFSYNGAINAVAKAGRWERQNERYTGMIHIPKLVLIDTS